MATALMVIAHKGFRDEELFEAREELESAGVEVKVASTETTPASGKLGGVSPVDVDIASAGKDFDAIVFVGGPGASVYYTHEKALSLARGYFAAGKVTAAICIAPGVLAKAGVLKGKKATIWNDAGGYDKMIVDGGGEYVDQSVVIDGNIITANGPAAAREFGRAIASVLK